MLDGVRARFVEARADVRVPVGLIVVGLLIAVAAQQDHVHVGIPHAADEHRQQLLQPRAQHLRVTITYKNNCNYSQLLFTNNLCNYQNLSVGKYIHEKS